MSDTQRLPKPWSLRSWVHDGVWVVSLVHSQTPHLMGDGHEVGPLLDRAATYPVRIALTTRPADRNAPSMNPV